MAENATVGMDEMAENATTLGHECLFWDISFGALFYTGNVLVGIGFVIPQSYAYSLISFRATMVIGGTTFCELSMGYHTYYHYL